MFLRLLPHAAAALVLAASAATAQTAIAQTTPSQTTPSQTTPSQSTATPQTGGDPVVARVDGTELHRSDVLAAQKSLPQQMQQMPIEQIFSPLVDQLVTGLLITEAGRKDKLADDPEVKKKMARLEDRAIQEVYINRMIEKAASDDELHKRYDQFVKDHPPKEEVSARHILVDKEEEAKAIIADLDKGADFAALAKQKSTDPGKDNGGDLGFFKREDMVPEFSEAAFKLKKGEYTKQPVHSQFGWHVIMVEDRRLGAPPSFEEAKAELTNEVAREVVGERIKELRSGAKIETFAIDGSPLPAKN
jgi:peptidyl-prolyl cis-trans isomerase C